MSERQYLWFFKELSESVGRVVYETPICVALATAPQNGLCFAFDIRHFTATLTMIYICGFAAGGGYEGVWGICPQI